MINNDEDRKFALEQWKIDKYGIERILNFRWHLYDLLDLQQIMLNKFSQEVVL